MSATPAAVLARLKAEYPDWEITRHPDVHTPGFLAVHREDSRRRIEAIRVGVLEYELHRAADRRIASNWGSPSPAAGRREANA